MGTFTSLLSIYGAMVIFLGIFFLPVIFFLERGDRKRARKEVENWGYVPDSKSEEIHPSISKRAIKIAVVTTIIALLLLFLNDNPNSPSLLSIPTWLIWTYASAYFYIWVVRKIWKFDFKREMTDEEKEAEKINASGELTSSQRETIGSFTRENQE